MKHQKISRCAMGTDGEEQLSNAFATFFLKLQSCCVHSINVIILKQQLHKRDNIKTKLRELLVPEMGSKK